MRIELFSLYFLKERKLHILQFTDLIGEGAFSCVYHGSYQGSEVAVKQLKIPLSSQDKNYFAAEVPIYITYSIVKNSFQ